MVPFFETWGCITSNKFPSARGFSLFFFGKSLFFESKAAA